MLECDHDKGNALIPLNDGYGGQRCPRCGMLMWSRSGGTPLNQYVTVVDFENEDHTHDLGGEG